MDSSSLASTRLHSAEAADMHSTGARTVANASFRYIQKPGVGVTRNQTNTMPETRSGLHSGETHENEPQRGSESNNLRRQRRLPPAAGKPRGSSENPLTECTPAAAPRRV